MTLRAMVRACVFGVATLLTACSSVDYDAHADQQLSNISTEVNQQFLTWSHDLSASPAKAPEYDTKFYNKVEAEITTLGLRMQSVENPATDRLAGNFDSLIAQLNRIRTRHRETGFSAVYIDAQRDLFNTKIALLMTFELSLKSGDSASAKTTSAATVNSAKASAASTAKLSPAER